MTLNFENKTSTYTTFFREPNLQIMPVLALSALFRTEYTPEVPPGLKLLVIGASYPEMFSLSYFLWQLLELRAAPEIVQPRLREYTQDWFDKPTLPITLLGLNNQPDQLTMSPDHQAIVTDRFPQSERLGSWFDMRRHDILSNPFPETGFHGVIMNNVLLHYDYADQSQMVTNALQSLIPGGFFSFEQGGGAGYQKRGCSGREYWHSLMKDLLTGCANGHFSLRRVMAQDLSEVVSPLVRRCLPDFSSSQQTNQHHRYYQYFPSEYGGLDP